MLEVENEKDLFASVAKCPSQLGLVFLMIALPLWEGGERKRTGTTHRERERERERARERERERREKMRMTRAHDVCVFPLSIPIYQQEYVVVRECFASWRGRGRV